RYDPHYPGYFACFNVNLYYEAHDVLEELWLAEKPAPNSDYYKGLIQFAGAFVHLQKQRLNPSFRLFHLALANFQKYPEIHLSFDLANAKRLCLQYIERLENSGFTENPYTPESAPRLSLLTD
ncbi:MAG TPA: DUF309 domain-containing protein, partial [Candidatus Methylacidiphilales bacterium]|nr:DUF309 domain-containing protein [Candidatus Methylacidiphilales bacterium]